MMWDFFKTNFKYCPKCSSMNLQIREGKSIYCVDCGFTYFHNVAAAAAVIIECQGRILLTRRGRDPKKGGLDLPGGFIDYHESAEAGLIREVKEELNLDLPGVNYLTSAPNLYEYKNITYPVMDVLFWARVDSLAGIKPQDDVEAFEMYDPRDIKLEEIVFPSTRHGVKTYLQRLGVI